MISLTVITADDGVIDGCTACSSKCHYGCCSQLTPDDPLFGPESSIMLYPGEWEGVSEAVRAHLRITLDNFREGKLAYCDKDTFDQSKCSPMRNFKPLDCQSYPFAPAFEEGNLILKIDAKKCPLDPESLRGHYRVILMKWQEVIQRNPAVELWIQSLDLKGYMPYDVA